MRFVCSFSFRSSSSETFFFFIRQLLIIMLPVPVVVPAARSFVMHSPVGGTS
jgi:hypothetical protein